VQVTATLDKPGDYSLDVSCTLPVDVFREWYHRLQRGNAYYPDALAPVRMPYRSRLPEPDNQIADQKAQAFWLDVWIPPDAKTGDVPLKVGLQSDQGSAEQTLVIRVLPVNIPEDDVVVMDHNSYGSSWIGEQYAGKGADFYRSQE